MLFRELNETEEKEFRSWARENYVVFSPIKGIWHPVVQDECIKMNRERSEIVLDESTWNGICVDDSDD